MAPMLTHSVENRFISIIFAVLILVVAPLFVLPRHRLADIRPVGTNHLRADLASESGGRIQGMAFRSVDTPLGDFLARNRGATLHVVGSLSANHWNGSRRVQFRIVDAAPA